MPIYERHKPGSFCWAEAAVDDPEAVSGFYTGLFGWDVEATPLPGDMGSYYGFKKGGKAVAAASGKPPGQENVPAHWNLYVSTDDAAQSAKLAESAGGTILAPAFDVMELGRMAVFADPTGAVISVWEPKAIIGAEVMSEHGAVTWNELMTTDTAKARDFYAEVFGWTAQENEMPSGMYTVFMNGEQSEAGMMKMPEGMDAPPSWTAYFGHEDAASGVERVKELGGRVLMGPETVPAVGTFAWATDTQGAVFAILTPEEWPK